MLVDKALDELSMIISSDRQDASPDQVTIWQLKTDVALDVFAAWHASYLREREAFFDDLRSAKGVEQKAAVFVNICRLDSEYARVMQKFEILAKGATALVGSSIDVLSSSERRKFFARQAQSTALERRVGELERASSETKQTIIQLLARHPEVTGHLEEVGLWPI
jgi:hypothetical protein